MLRNIKSKAQSTTEYAVLIAVVAAALFAMQVYLKRGVQGRIRDLATQISPTQYEAGQTRGEYRINQSGEINQAYGTKTPGVVTQSQRSETNQTETITRSSNEVVLPEAAE